MNHHYLKKAVLGAIFATTLVFASPTVFAQAGAEGVQIKPAIIEDRVNPGQLYRFTVKVTNLSETERTFYLLARDISGIDERGVPVFLEEGQATAFELSSWVRLPQESVTLKAGQTTDVPFTVQVPADATPGAHFGGVFFELRPDQSTGTGAAVGARVGSIINLRIAGETTEEMRLREFSTEKFIYDTPPVTFTTKVDNLGNVLLRPHGLIEITDMFGKRVGEVEINKSAAAVFPGGDRVYSATWEYQGFAFGRYHALLSFVYGEDGRKTVVRTATFWVLPLKPTLIALSSLVGLILAVYFTIKLYIRRKLRDMGVSTRVDARLNERRHTRPVSRLVFIVFGIVIFIMVILLILFLMFA